MRKSKEEAAATRRRIVGAGSAELRRNGIEGTGLAGLMGAAGLTHGGFYKHFDSKEQVVDESLAFAIAAMAGSMRSTVESSPGGRGLRKVVEDYLSIEYQRDIAGGCPFVALASEIARSGDAIRQTATDGFLEMVDIIASRLEDLSPPAAKKEALVMMCTMIGAATMARVVTDSSLSKAIRDQARKHLNDEK
jgi:TetR/AcrR family transcriptional repressor of nem operon